jgi:8-oxo-dGTP diphosphatase
MGNEDRSVKRVVRYQGAVVRDGYILLVRQRFGSEYECWNVPGGGRADDETGEQCVIREIKEETNLDVRIERLLIDGPSHPHSPYQRFKTYLCTPVQGDVTPDGVESVEVRWFDLSDPSQLSLEALNSDTAFTTVQRIRQVLGYT